MKRHASKQGGKKAVSSWHPSYEDLGIYAENLKKREERKEARRQRVMNQKESDDANS